MPRSGRPTSGVAFRRMTIRAKVLTVLLLAVLALAGCGGDHQAQHKPSATRYLANGAPKPALRAPACHVTATSGEMGACAPKPPVTAAVQPPRNEAGFPRFIDLSNNNPISGAGLKKVKAAGFRG